MSSMTRVRRIDRSCVMCQSAGCGSQAEFIVESEWGVRPQTVPLIAAYCEVHAEPAVRSLGLQGALPRRKEPRSSVLVKATHPSCG